MKRTIKNLALAAGSLSSVISLAFVAKINDQGEFRRWQFDNPPASVSENVFNRETKAIRFSLAEEAFSESAREAELNAVRAAFGQWEAVPNSIIKFEEGPLVPNQFDINPGDGTNIVKWATSSTLVNGEMSDIRGRLGLAFTLFFADGRMAAADIVMNGVEHNWFPDPANPNDDSHFIEGTVIHELGHVLGLDHTPLGAGTMFARDGSGIGFQSGLSLDEIAFAQSIYADENDPRSLGSITGKVQANGQGILGAALFLETETGQLIAGTLSIEATEGNEQGFYSFLGVPPGDYQLRAQPLDAATASRTLVRGRDISFSRFNQSEINFTPTEARSVSVSDGERTTVDFTLDLIPPAFRIDRIRQFTNSPNGIRSGNSPISLAQGEQDKTIGVFGTSLPTTDVDLLITGDGLTLGPTEVTTQFFSSLPHLFRKVSVSSDATPGLRSFIVKRGNDHAYATGFIEIRALEPDDNFDGLSDNFQRQHFAPFTAPEAAPAADPDKDGRSNAEEAQLGSNPTVPNDPSNPDSLLSIQSVSLDSNGATIRFESLFGTSYQLFTRESVTDGSWAPIGQPIQGNGTLRSITDTNADADIRFYEVRVSTGN